MSYKIYNGTAPVTLACMKILLGWLLLQFFTCSSADILWFFRPYWRCYFPNTQAIIYVVDSSDTERLVIAKEEFHAILEVFFVLITTISLISLV